MEKEFGISLIASAIIHLIFAIVISFIILPTAEPFKSPIIIPIQIIKAEVLPTPKEEPPKEVIRRPTKIIPSEKLQRRPIRVSRPTKPSRRLRIEKEKIKEAPLKPSEGRKKIEELGKEKTKEVRKEEKVEAVPLPKLPSAEKDTPSLDVKLPNEALDASAKVTTVAEAVGPQKLPPSVGEPVVKITGPVIVVRKPIHKAKFELPKWIEERGIKPGNVKIKFWVTTDGIVDEAIIITSCGYREIDKLAERALKMWRFEPVTIDSEGRDWGIFTVEIKLK